MHYFYDIKDNYIYKNINKKIIFDNDYYGIKYF